LWLARGEDSTRLIKLIALHRVIMDFEQLKALCGFTQSLLQFDAFSDELDLLERIKTEMRRKKGFVLVCLLGNVQVYAVYLPAALCGVA
jgi:hypothetical protein